MFAKLLTRLRLLRHGLYSAPLKEKEYDTKIADRPIRLFHSRFNPNWLTQLGISPKTILDLGSYDGGDAFRFTEAFPSCRVITLEADPMRISLVRENLEGSPVEIKQYAACDQDGPVEWYSAEANGKVDGQGSMFAHTDHYRKTFDFVKQTDKPASVDGIRVDSLCEQLGISEIDFLHMDIEGAENVALRSLGKMRPKAIFLETVDDRFVGGPSVTNTHRLLEEMGYRCVVDLDSDRLYVSATACKATDRSQHAA